MKLQRYNNFTKSNNSNIESIDENVAQAKKYLVDKYIQDNEIKKEDLKPEQIREIEKLPDYIKIRDLLVKNAGWTYVFTRFHFEDGVEFEELKSLYDKLTEFKNLLNRLPKPVDRYLESEKRNNDLERTAYEDLSDDLEKISRYRNYKHFIDELPAQVKKEAEASGTIMISKIENLAVEFYKLDPSLQKNFIKKLSRYRFLNDLVRVMESYLKASTGHGFANFIKKVEEVNARLTEKHGAEIIYINEEEERIIVELRSYEACKALCANTSWCIAQYHGHWESYVGGDDVYAKQYAVFDFSLSPGDNYSIMGCTVNQGNKWRASHLKNDSSISEREFRGKLSKEENELIVGPNKEEVEAKKRYVKASKILKENKITVDQAKKAILDGAAVNTGSGIALVNAVKNGNLELVQYLLSVGSVPNLSPNENDPPINFSSDLEITKTLVAAGANFTPKAFRNFIDSRTGEYNKEAIQYFLDNGMNINFDSAYALRVAAKSDNLDLVKYLIEKGADPNAKSMMPIVWGAEYGKPEGLDYMLNHAKINLSDLTPLERIFRLSYRRIYKNAKDRFVKDKGSKNTNTRLPDKDLYSDSKALYEKTSNIILEFAKKHSKKLEESLLAIKKRIDLGED